MSRFAAIAGGVLLLALAGPGRVAGEPIDRRLAQRLDAPAAAAVWQVVESARAGGIPTDPLIATALEGATKRAPAEAIVLAVRQHAAALTASREALGEQSSPTEIEAGAGVLLSGVLADSLVRLRAMRPHGSLVIPLVVLADLVTRQVPVNTAAGALVWASGSGARDADLLRLRSRVEADIRHGVSPNAATLARARGLESNGPARAQQPALPRESAVRRRTTP